MINTKSTRKIEYGDVVVLKWGDIAVGIVRNNPYDDKEIVLEIHPLSNYSFSPSSLNDPGVSYIRSFSPFDPVKQKDRILSVCKTPEEVYQMLMDRFQETLRGIRVSTNVAKVKI